MASIIDKALDIFNSPAVQNVLDTGEVAAGVYAVTKDSDAAGRAAGYAAWIFSITGSYPKVQNLGDGRVRLTHTPEQIQKMQLWLDGHVTNILTPKKTLPNMQIDFGPIVKPWAMKYTIPAFVGVFAVGWLTRWLIYK